MFPSRRALSLLPLLRCCSHGRPNYRRSTNRGRRVEAKRPCYSEQYLASWVSPLGLLFLDLPHLTEFFPVLDAESTAQEHELGFHRSVCSGDIVNISVCMFQTSGDGRRTS